MYWDRSPILSYNKIFNMILSNRGGGKTFNMTRWAIDDFKKTGKQTMWVRRYDTELTDKQKGILVNDRFFKAVRHLYPNDELKVEGYSGMVNGEVAIEFVALSTSRQLKSVNFPNTNKIIFDEFIVAKDSKNGYLKSETEIFLDLYETVDRMRDETRAVLLANSVETVNPYFQYFGIKIKKNDRFTVKGEICVERFTNKEFVEKKKQTRFGKLVSNTRYGRYAIDNEWLMDNETFVEPKSPKAEFMLGMKYNGVMYGFWVDYKIGLIYVTTQHDPYSHALYCLTKEDHDPNLLLIKSLNDNARVKRIVYAFRNGLLRFEDMAVKNQFYEFIGFFVR